MVFIYNILQLLALLNKSVFQHSRWLYDIIFGLLLHLTVGR